MPIPTQIIAACEACFNANSNNCSGFVKAVAHTFHITLTGLADDIVDQIKAGSWVKLANGIDAKNKADAGWFVIGGLKGHANVPAQQHGHVVVVVSGPLDDAHHKYPTAYWGKLGGVGKKNTPINWAWNSASRDKVIYAGINLNTGL